MSLILDLLHVKVACATHESPPPLLRKIDCALLPSSRSAGSATLIQEVNAFIC